MKRIGEARPLCRLLHQCADLLKAFGGVAYLDQAENIKELHKIVGQKHGSAVLLAGHQTA